MFIVFGQIEAPQANGFNLWIISRGWKLKKKYLAYIHGGWAMSSRLWRWLCAMDTVILIRSNLKATKLMDERLEKDIRMKAKAIQTMLLHKNYRDNDSFTKNCCIYRFTQGWVCVLSSFLIVFLRKKRATIHQMGFCLGKWPLSGRGINYN